MVGGAQSFNIVWVVCAAVLWTEHLSVRFVGIHSSQQSVG